MKLWETRRLGDVVDHRLGKMLDEQKNKGEFLPYLRNINVRWGSFDLDNLSEMRFELDELDRYGLKYGDIVMCEGGEPGRCAIWKDEKPGMMIQKALHRIRPSSCLDNRFLYYTFLHMGRTGGFSSLFTGATIRHLPGQNLAKVEIRIPALPTQRSIAGTLSAYDDLIENNRRRIQLLEEAARLLYREWFVHLRFPGHEHVAVVDGVPEGWERLALSDVADFINGFAFKPSDLGEEGFPIVKIPELRDGITAKTPRNPGDSVPEKFHLSDGDLLFSWSGTLAANIWVGGTALLNQHLFNVLPKGEVDRAFLMYTIREALPTFDNHTVGATMKHIRRSALDNVLISVPTKGVLQAAEATLNTTYEQMINLRKQNQHLAKARDLLLPRLMNGEIPT